MFVAAALLLIDTFLDWQKVSAKIGGVEVASASLNAWHGFWGVLMGLLTLALLAWLIASMAGVTMQLPVSDALLSAALGVAILICAVLKGLTDEFSTVWAWIGVALAGLIALGAYLRVQESGGMDKLRADASEMRSSRQETPPPAPPEERRRPSSDFFRGLFGHRRLLRRDRDLLGRDVGRKDDDVHVLGVALAADEDRRAGLELAAEHEVGERVLDEALDRAAQRPGAHRRVVALLDEQLLRLVRQLDRDLVQRPSARARASSAGRRSSTISSFSSLWKTMTSSMRFSSSGRKTFFSSLMTRLFMSS